MATKVEAFEVRNRASKYPWAELTDGSVWELKKGTDYENISSMRAITYVTAAARKLNVRTMALDGGKRFQLQFTPGPRKAKRKPSKA